MGNYGLSKTTKANKLSLFMQLASLLKVRGGGHADVLCLVLQLMKAYPASRLCFFMPSSQREVGRHEFVD